MSGPRLVRRIGISEVFLVSAEESRGLGKWEVSKLVDEDRTAKPGHYLSFK